jgi:transposase
MQNCNVLGIDVAKESLAVFNQKTKQFFEIPNQEKALEKIVKEQCWKAENYLVALESTGDYSFLPMQFFSKQGFKIKLLNPIVTKKFTKATIRGKKTDRSDAQAIAELAGFGEGQFVTEKDLKITRKTLIRLENKITHFKSDLKRMKKSLETKQQNRIEMTEAIHQMETLITATETAAKNIWKLSREETDKQERIISSHIGCGEKISAVISSEAGDIKRFPSARQFKAYAGIDPKVYQSGDKNVKGRMTKRGNPLLRKALFIAAFVASKHDPELSLYYQKKRAEGKAHRLSVCAVARKLCERIYSTVINNRLYQPNYPSEGNLT